MPDCYPIDMMRNARAFVIFITLKPKPVLNISFTYFFCPKWIWLDSSTVLHGITCYEFELMVKTCLFLCSVWFSKTRPTEWKQAWWPACKWSWFLIRTWTVDLHKKPHWWLTAWRTSDPSSLAFLLTIKCHSFPTIRQSKTVSSCYEQIYQVRSYESCKHWWPVCWSDFLM